MVPILTLLVASGAPAQTPTGLPFAEEFNFNNLEDVDRTTADWNNSSGIGVAGQVVLPSAAALTGPLFDNTSTAIGPASVTRGIAVGDFNGDGFPDFVEANSGNNSANRVFLNDGTGLFNLAYSTPDNFSTTRSVDVGDVDGDGDLDFVEGNFGSDPPRLYLNDGTGTGFVVQNIRSAARSIDDIALVDVNQDGFPDVILANDNGTERNLLILNSTDPLTPFGPNGTPGSNLPGPSSDQSKEILAGDLDNDGDLDLVMLNEGINRVHMNTGAGFTNDALNDPLDPDGFQNSHGGALGDLDGDGFLDLVVIDFLNNEISNVYINDGSMVMDQNPFTIAPVELPDIGDPDFEQNASLADADNDGDLDIYVSVAGEGETNRVYINDGSGTSYTVVELGVNATVSNDGVAVDVDGDGDIDFLTGSQGLDVNLNAIPANNDLYLNMGAGNPPGAAALQLSALATSEPVNGMSGINANGVRLGSMEVSTGLTLHNDIQYWVSNNDGGSWVRALPGRPVNFASASTGQLVWRAFLRSGSPFNAGALGLDQLTLANNTAAPLCDDNTDVTETEGTPITAIVANCPDADGDTVYYSMSGLPANSGLSFDVATRTLSGTPNNFDAAASPINLTFTGSDGAVSGQDFLELTVTNTNDPPQIDSIPTGFIDAGPPVTAGATPGVLYSYTIMASDIDPGDALTITAPTLPSWVTTFMDNGDGTALLEGTPSIADVANNNHAVSIVVTDSAMAMATQDYEIIVDNNAPGFTSAAVVDATQDVLYSYDITASDPDMGDTLTISATGAAGGALPAWLGFVDNGDGTANLSGTPGAMDVGSFDIELTVTDANGETGNQNFTITVMNVNDAPTFTSIAVTAAQQDLTYTYNVTTQDADPGDVLTITAPTLPAWLNLTDNGDGTATLTGTPGNPEVGDHDVVLEVSDGIAAPVQQMFTITVDDVNEAPSIDSVAVTGATQGVAYTYNITTTDPDPGDVLTITAPTLPTWLTLTDNGDGTATLTGTPGPADTGDNDVTLTVTDAGNLSGNQSFTIAVANINDAPTFTSMPVTGVTEAVEYLYNISTNDADGDMVTITALTLPGWLTLTDNGDGTGELRATPTGAEVGDHQVVLSVQDPSMASNTQTFTVTVVAAADGPVITILGDNPVTVSLGSTYTDAGAEASDPQDGDLTGDIVTDNPVNTAVAGTYTVTYSVTDSAGNTVQAQRTVNVPSNQAPVLDNPIANQTARAGDNININAADNVSDPDGDSLTFSATGLPASLSISAAGEITGTLTAGDVNNSPYDITVTATDPGGLSVTADFRLTVNSAPPPPASGGGGGSTGLLELLGMLLLGAGGGALRRRRPALER